MTTTHILKISSRVGNMFRSITGDYEAAAPVCKGVWKVAHIAIKKANRHSVRHLRTFRQAGPKTTAELLAASALVS